MDKKRFLIVGMGNRGIFFGKSLLGWPDKGLPEFTERAELVALSDRNLSRAQACKDELRRRPAPELLLFRDAADAVRQTRPDWAIVTVPDHAHADVCCGLLELGVNVLVEKPLATSVWECRRIIDTAKRTGRQIRVAHNYRHMRWVLRAERLVRQGRIGHILSVEAAEILGNRHGADYFHRWHRDFANSGGMLIQKACHHFDLMNWILRDRPACVSAFGSRALYAARPDLDHAGRCDDCKLKPTCHYSTDLNIWDGIRRRMYKDAEHEDGYIRDRCVFEERLKDEAPGERMKAEGGRMKGQGRGSNLIYDNHHLNIQFAGGAIASYALTNFGPRETVYANFTGVDGCIEAGHDQLTNKEHVTLIANDGKTESFIEDDEGGMDGHGGADARMVAAFLGLRGKDIDPDSLSTAEEAMQAVMGADLGNRSLARGGVPVWAEEAGSDLAPAPPGRSWAQGKVPPSSAPVS